MTRERRERRRGAETARDADESRWEGATNLARVARRTGVAPRAAMAVPREVKTGSGHSCALL